jgi:hypothetical protein
LNETICLQAGQEYPDIIYFSIAIAACVFTGLAVIYAHAIHLVFTCCLFDLLCIRVRGGVSLVCPDKPHFYFLFFTSTLHRKSNPVDYLILVMQ